MTTQKDAPKEADLTPEELELHEDRRRGWENSNAKAVLHAHLVENKIPLYPRKDESLEDISSYFHMREEIINYGGSKNNFKAFKRRLNSLREDTVGYMKKSEDDEKALEIFKKNDSTIYQRQGNAS